MLTPQWATDLADTICEDEGVSERPQIVFRKRYSFYSTGRANSRIDYRETARINVTAGRDEDYCRLVFIHEMAHWLLPHNAHHGPQFWDKAFDLYYRYGIDGAYAIANERNYRKEASSAYNRSKFVVVDKKQPEYFNRRSHPTCYCACHKYKVKA